MIIFLKSYIQKINKKNIKFLIFCYMLLAIFIFLISMFVGVSKISVSEVFNWIFFNTKNSKLESIILYVRLPRALAALLSGCALATSGLLLQSTLNNALVSPATIGANAGAGLFIVIASAVFPSFLFTKSIFAFAGAILITLTVYTIAEKTGASRMTIILSGVAVTSLCNAIIDTIVTIKPNTLIDKSSFYIGGLHQTTLNQILFSLPYILIGLFGAFIMASQINIMVLGDDVAYSLGVHIKRTRFFIIVFSSFLTASAVNMVGLLGFVGLIVPHIVRLVVKNDFKLLLPITAISGAILVLLCDMLSRILFMPYEIPVGIILSLLGAPFFLFLLFKSGKRGRFID